MIGAISIADLDVEEFKAKIKVFGTRGLLIRRHIADAISPSSPPGVQRQHPSKRWWRSKAIGGQPRTVLRPRKTSSGFDHNERQILAWVASHVSLVMLASP